jgi:hypothetical protein
MVDCYVGAQECAKQQPTKLVVCADKKTFSSYIL